MALNFRKARIAAVLEQPPELPNTERMDLRTAAQALERYHRARDRWQRIGKVLDGAHLPYREITNSPSSIRGMHGSGTLHKPFDARITDCSIVHTRPNHAQRRAAGRKGPWRQDELEDRAQAIHQAAEACRLRAQRPAGTGVLADFWAAA